MELEMQTLLGLLSLEPGHGLVNVAQLGRRPAHEDDDVNGRGRESLGLRLSLPERCPSFLPSSGAGLGQCDGRERVSSSASLLNRRAASKAATPRS